MESTKRGKEQINTEEQNKDKHNFGEGAARGTVGNQSISEQQTQGQGNGSAQVIDQAKQAVTDAYNRTSQTLNETYSQAMDYGRQHPGQLTLIAFGAGIGIGLLLSSGI